MTDEPLSREISQPISREISGASRSSRSYGRTDGLTENLTNPPLKSSTSVPRAHIFDDQGFAVDWRRYAPTNPSADLQPFYESMDGWIDDYEIACFPMAVLRRGNREPICWHIRSMIKQRDDYRCRWCGANAGWREVQIDHITPWSAGGSHDSRNLQVLCVDCNDLKTNRPDSIRKAAPGIVVECVRCREPDNATRGDLVWCFTCRDFSHERTAWTDLAQRFLLGHCTEILRPKIWTADVAKLERIRLIDAWQGWYPAARDTLEREIRDALRDLVIEHQAASRSIASKQAPAQVEGRSS